MLEGDGRGRLAVCRSESGSVEIRRVRFEPREPADDRAAGKPDPLIGRMRAGRGIREGISCSSWKTEDAGSVPASGSDPEMGGNCVSSSFEGGGTLIQLLSSKFQSASRRALNMKSWVTGSSGGVAGLPTISMGTMILSRSFFKSGIRGSKYGEMCGSIL